MVGEFDFSFYQVKSPPSLDCRESGDRYSYKDGFCDEMLVNLLKLAALHASMHTSVLCMVWVGDA